MVEIISPDQRIATLSDNVVARTHEIEAYQINIDNYVVMLAALPSGEWPSNIADYKGVQPDQLPPELSDATVQIVSDYQFRDRIVGLLRSERIEQGKSQRVLDALKAQIPADKYDEAISAAVMRRGG